MQRQRFPRSACRIVSSSGVPSRDRRSMVVRMTPGRAEAALEAVVLDERPLHRMEIAVRREPLDRRDLAAVGLEREQRAALHGPPVDEHRACAALARVAADMRARQPEPVAQGMDEQRTAFDLERALLAVDRQRKLRHPVSPRRCRRREAAGRSGARCSRARARPRCPATRSTHRERRRSARGSAPAPRPWPRHSAPRTR